jgi:hypothetical protein
VTSAERNEPHTTVLTTPRPGLSGNHRGDRTQSDHNAPGPGKPGDRGGPYASVPTTALA